MKKIKLFIVSLIFFSFSIFILKNYFFGVSENILNKNIEKIYIEPSVNSLEYISDKNTFINKDNLIINNKKVEVDLKSADDIISYIYFPKEFKKEASELIYPYKVFLDNKSIFSKIYNLEVELHKQKNDVRGKMKNAKVKLFGIENMQKDELVAVGIHEFGHFIDLYFLKKGVYTDLSDYFYDISWKSTKVIKPGQKQIDFVSGYSMTNKYEDFAESFTYFILDNNDFLVKSKKSKILKQKYDFFVKYLFRDGKFIGTDFSVDNKILDYYRDITKIDFSLKNFLEFLKK